MRKNNTFQINGKHYEAPRDLRTRKIQVRFNRADPGRIIVFYKGERMGEATELDFLGNDRPPALSKRQAANQTRNQISGQ